MGRPDRIKHPGPQQRRINLPAIQTYRSNPHRRAVAVRAVRKEQRSGFGVVDTVAKRLENFDSTPAVTPLRVECLGTTPGTVGTVDFPGPHQRPCHGQGHLGIVGIKSGSHPGIDIVADFAVLSGDIRRRPAFNAGTEGVAEGGPEHRSGTAICHIDIVIVVHFGLH